MPLYSFIAKSRVGETQVGQREAKDEQDLARLLRQEDLLLIEGQDLTKAVKHGFSLPSLGISLSEKMFFTRNLQIMISAGLSLPRALEALSGQAKNQKFKKALLNIKEEVLKGKAFSACLSDYPDIFSDIFQSMIKVGEESGTVEEVLKILSLQMEREYDLKSKVTSALLYPLVIVFAMFGIGVLMLVTVVPQLASTFEELQIPLPLTTRVVIAIAGFLTEKWYLALAIIAVAGFPLFRFIKTKSGQRKLDYLSMKLPVISAIVQKLNTAYAARNLGSLITAGVSLPRALEITSNTLSNVYFRETLFGTVEQVRKGRRLSEALGSSAVIFPATFLQMISVGEETGETSSILIKLADFFEEEVSNTTKNLASVIEPILMLFIGVVVGFFAISMIQPLYSMLNTLE